MLAFLIGTILTTLGGLLLGAPLGIGTAVFIDQVAPPKMANAIRRGVELLAGIPSVVIGWFGLIIAGALHRQRHRLRRLRHRRRPPWSWR